MINIERKVNYVTPELKYLPISISDGVSHAA